MPVDPHIRLRDHAVETGSKSSRYVVVGKADRRSSHWRRHVRDDHGGAIMRFLEHLAHPVPLLGMEPTRIARAVCGSRFQQLEYADSRPSPVLPRACTPTAHHRRTGKNRIGIAIRTARLQRDWSQEQMAFECGLHRTYIGAVERGKKISP
jgi:hypothetical protein